MIQNRHSTIHVKGVPKDADGNVTTLDGAAKVTSDNPAVTDALAGSGPVSVEGDADKSPDAVKTISGKLDVTVPAGDAVTVDLQVGAETANQPPTGGGTPQQA